MQVRPAVQVLMKTGEMHFFKNLFKTPETSLEVSCEAVSCVYNEDCRCQADKISIGGGKACQCEQTECASFRAR